MTHMASRLGLSLKSRTKTEVVEVLVEGMVKS